MGLVSIAQKITSTVSVNIYDEIKVVYLLIEAKKYLERGAQNLGDSRNLILHQIDYPFVKFFRNWVAHPLKSSRDVPQSILVQLALLSSDDVNINQDVEHSLFDSLKNELCNFYRAIGINLEVINGINWVQFFVSLKGILSEQPIQLANDIEVGFESEDGVLSRLNAVQN